MSTRLIFIWYLIQLLISQWRISGNILIQDNASTGSGDDEEGTSSSSATPEELVLQEKDRQELEIGEFCKRILW